MEHLEEILFIDIETVPVTNDYLQLSAGMQEQWNRKIRSLKFLNSDAEPPEALFMEKAGIYSEFARIVCIGIGCLSRDADLSWKLLLKSLTAPDERTLLHSFTGALSKFGVRYPQFRFCGHNIREFDLPFLCRRMVIHNMPLPASLQLQGKKPWEILHIDTLELWRFGDYKNYTSLALLAEVLGIPSPKEDMDGSMVGKMYWEEKNTGRIARYCLQDVLTTARVYLRMKGYGDINPEAIYLPDNS